MTDNNNNMHENKIKNIDTALIANYISVVDDDDVRVSCTRYT